MQKVLFLLFVVSCFSFSIPSGTTAKVQWLSFKELEKKLQEKELPVLVDIYTDWCGWCKVMDRKTYAESNVAKYMNQKFYAVKFNAESKEDITWRGKTYSYNQRQRIHSLTNELIKGEMGFPNTVFIPGKTAEPISVAGYMTPQDFQVYLTYFGEEKNRKKDFQAYANSFKPTW